MLAVDFPSADAAGRPVPAQVNVSGQLYAACDNAIKLAAQDDPMTTAPPPCDVPPNVLPNDPVGAIQNSLTLPLIEPRSYAGDESPSVTYEGRVIADRIEWVLVTGTRRLMDDSRSECRLLRGRCRGQPDDLG